MSSSDMCVDQPVTETSVHDIEMPMAPELKQASRKLTKDSFQRVKVLGRGSFGEVFLVYKKSDGPDSRRMAMKVVKKRVVRENEEIDHMRNERAGKTVYSRFFGMNHCSPWLDKSSLPDQALSCISNC